MNAMLVAQKIVLDKFQFDECKLCSVLYEAFYVVRQMPIMSSKHNQSNSIEKRDVPKRWHLWNIYNMHKHIIYTFYYYNNIVWLRAKWIKNGESIVAGFPTTEMCEFVNAE